MKAAIFNPYLDTLGGGERYTISFAKVLAEVGYEVYLQWDNQMIKEKIKQRFGITLEDVNFVKDIKRGEGYDVCFWVSDGSIPLLRARKNFLHFQVPFKNVGGRSLLNKMKLFRIDKIICNSYFTKSFIDEEFGVNSIVIYPPVDVSSIKPKRKENIILSVARFSELLQSKRQDVLVESFKKLLKKGLSGWKLVLAGGSEVGAGEFLGRLKRSAKGYPIEILENPPFKKLVSLYGRSKIFWSAVGFGVNANKYPMKVEHFGISVVEAMAAGCVPLVYNAGGHIEIVNNGQNGYLWSKIGELVKLTLMLSRAKQKLNKLSRACVLSSRNFGYERFEKEVQALI